MNKTINYNDGTFYQGEVNANGQPHGKGYIRFNNGDSYEGDFRDNCLTGTGIYHYKDGSVYHGEMINASRNGRGKMTLTDGTVNDGIWSNGFLNGYATVTYPDGESISGNWKDSNLDGNFVHTWPTGHRFEGTAVNGNTLNHGIVYYQNGSIYDGDLDVKNSYSANGNGTLKETDGVIYRGTFKDNRMDGLITVSYTDGSTEVCQYSNGEFIKTISHVDRNGNEIVQQSEGFSQLARDLQNRENISVDSSKYLTAENDDNSEYARELQPYFENLIGMKEVKNQLDGIYKRFKLDSMRQQLLGITGQKQGYYFIITGNPGTGKTTVARIIGMMLHDTGILEKQSFVEVDRSRLVGEFIGQTEKRTSEAIESARGGTLFIDEAYALYRKDSPNDFGKEAIDTLLKDMEDHRGQYCVILAGYRDQMNDMIRNANPGLASRFDHHINIPDYSSDELVRILVSMALQKHFFIERQAKEVIISRLEKEKIDDTFDNARFARRMLDEAIESQAKRLAENVENVDIEQLQVLKAEDFGSLEVSDFTLSSSLKQLNSLIGLQNVKQEINRLVQTVSIQAESRKRGLAIANDSTPLNLVFTGNPGTGKTTVARLVGQIYYHLGLLKRPDVFVECTRSDLVGRYQGETALKVKEVIRRALGGVLFIDEAYSLVMNDSDSFGIEAVNTLVSEIENNRDKIAVILAGYTEDMEHFLDSNPGLRSRLAKTIEFEDYEPDELMQIFHFDMSKRGYQVKINDRLLELTIMEKMSARDFGNARGIRNLVDATISNHNSRLFAMDITQLSNEMLTTITDEDLA